MMWPGLVTYHRAPGDRETVSDADAERYARRFYDLVEGELEMGMTLVTWRKLPQSRRDVFIRAMRKLMQGGESTP
jgi:hypothetical protein